MNYYHILGISQNASQQEIKKKYRALAIQHHPDKNNGNDLYFKQVNEAYQTLSNSKKRANYDFFLKHPIYTPPIQKHKPTKKNTNNGYEEPIRAKRYDEFTDQEKVDLEKRRVKYYKKSDKKFVKYVIISVSCFFLLIVIISYYDYINNINKYK